jgi:hypothetical protein
MKFKAIIIKKLKPINKNDREIYISGGIDSTGDKYI